MMADRAFAAEDVLKVLVTVDVPAPDDPVMAMMGMAF